MSRYEDNDIFVIDLVNEFLKRKSVEDNNRDNSYFHSSEFYGCKRKIAYKYYASQGIIKLKQEAIRIEPKLQLIFDNGHHVHYRWTAYLEDERCAGNLLKGYWKCKNAYAHEFAYQVNSKKREDCHPKIYGNDQKLGILKPNKPCKCGCADFSYEEIKLFDESVLLGGHIDGLLLLPTGKHVIIDYKSIGRRNFELLFQKPKPEHNIQMQCYLLLSGLKLGKLIYECKDNQNTKEITVLRDDWTIEQIKNDATRLKHIISIKKANGKRALPPRSNSVNPELDRKNGRKDVKIYEKRTGECIRCPFRTHCWKLE